MDQDQEIQNLEKTAQEFIENGNLIHLDRIASSLYGTGTTFRTLSAWGQESVKDILGWTSPDQINRVQARLDIELAHTAELEQQLRQAWDTIEDLEIDKYEMEMDILASKKKDQ